jgi:hypothetical protein
MSLQAGAVLLCGSGCRCLLVQGGLTIAVRRREECVWC